MRAGSASDGPAGVVAAGTAHADALAAIHGAAFPPAERWDAAAIATLLSTPGCFALLSAVGGMAMLRVAGDEAELLTLAVLPGARGRGVGGEVLAAALAEAARRGAAAVVLEVAPGNAAARTLYGRAGFLEIGRRPGYYPGGSDALVMRRGAAPGALPPDHPRA